MAGGINPFGFAVSAPQPAPRAPIDLPSAPFGFAPPPSKWEQTAAILNEYNPIDAFWRLYNSDMAKGGAITDQNIEDGMMVGGTVMGGGAMIPKPANALNMGIRAYHGSPHSFDKFSMDKIGTGEGAQAYGHGLYFAEREGIARSYRDALATGVKPELRPTDKYSTVGWKAEAEKLFPNDRERQAAFHLFNQMKNRDYVLENHDFITSLPHNQGKPYEWEGVEFTRDRLAQLADEFYDPGHMYEVNIDADPNAFLDWDKPLSEQPKSVQDALAVMDPDTYHPSGSDYDPTELGQIAYHRMFHDTRKKIGPNQGAKTYQAEISKTLNQAGIPGIKYLDAGSRYTPANLPNNPIANEARQFLDAAQGDGEKALQLFRDSNPVDRWAGSERDEITKVIKSAAKPVTRNYVVFDDNLISIVRKYGIAGASAMLGYNLLESVNPAQADELKRIEAGK